MICQSCGEKPIHTSRHNCGSVTISRDYYRELRELLREAHDVLDEDGHALLSSLIHRELERYP